MISSVFKSQYNLLKKSRMNQVIAPEYMRIYTCARVSKKLNLTAECRHSSSSENKGQFTQVLQQNYSQ